MSTENTPVEVKDKDDSLRDDVKITYIQYQQYIALCEQFASFDLENNVLVNRIELTALAGQNIEYKLDIIEMVNVFQVFAGLFEGKGMLSIVPVITKMMKDKSKMAELSGIVKVIDKYTAKNLENNG